MKIIYIIQFYFYCNIFLAGIVFNGYEREKYRLASTLIAVLFGLPLYLLSFIWEWVENIDTPIPFYYKFYFTKKYDNLSKEDLELINENLVRFGKKWHSKYVKMINKKNNYVHTGSA